MILFGLFFTITEIWKQVFLCVCVFEGELKVWYLPFQLCSMPLWLSWIWLLASRPGGGKKIRSPRPAALEWLTAAAEGGHTGAQYFLGACLFGGFGGTEPNQAEAMRHFQAAARQQPAASVVPVFMPITFSL